MLHGVNNLSACLCARVWECIKVFMHNVIKKIIMHIHVWLQDLVNSHCVCSDVLSYNGLLSGTVSLLYEHAGVS